MSNPPFRRHLDSSQAVEATFKNATTHPADPARTRRAAITPILRELVPLRIDQDVLQHFQVGGHGWQDRINDALRKAAGLRKPGPQDEGLRPDQLTSENDG